MKIWWSCGEIRCKRKIVGVYCLNEIYSKLGIYRKLALSYCNSGHGSYRVHVDQKSAVTLAYMHIHIHIYNRIFFRWISDAVEVSDCCIDFILWSKVEKLKENNEWALGPKENGGLYRAAEGALKHYVHTSKWRGRGHLGEVPKK